MLLVSRRPPKPIYGGKKKSNKPTWNFCWGPVSSDFFSPFIFARVVVRAPEDLRVKASTFGKTPAVKHVLSMEINRFTI